jgi:hypothetical protein
MGLGRVLPDAPQQRIRDAFAANKTIDDVLIVCVAAFDDDVVDRLREA